jgi:hypothetical protein
MKKNAILATLLMFAMSALAHAGGPPPLYVVVDKVVFNPCKSTAHWVQIWGTFTRSEKTVDKAGKETVAFSKPTYGYVYLSLPTTIDKKFEDELQDWEKAVGTGKAVAVGSCNDAGSMLKCPIHQPKETVTQPDADYKTGYLRLFGDMYANGEFNRQHEVAALLKFAKERK